MRVGVLFVALFVAVQAEDANLCQLDGENACRDYSTAAKCQTSNYCVAEIWNQPINDNTKLCQLCIADITNLQKFISAKTTRDFVKKDLLLFCSALPFDEARTECTKLVNENFDRIYEDIVEKLDPKTFCRALHLCLSRDLHQDIMEKVHKSMAMAVPWIPSPVSENDICHTEQKCRTYSIAKKCGILATCKTYVWSAPVKSDPICDMCKQEFQYLQDWAKNPNTKSMVKKDLLMFCDKLPIPTLKQDCHSIIDNDFDDIYNEIISLLSPDVMCSALGLCKAVYSEDTPQTTCELDGNNACLDYSTAARCKTLNYCKTIVWSKPVQSNNLCDTCKNDVARIQKFIDANSTKEFVQGELLAICKLLPWPKLQYKCQTMVIARFEEIYNDIVDLLDPQTVCRALFFCRNQGEEDIFSGLTLILKKESKSAKNKNLCALDSENACHDYLTAKKCDVLSTCKATVWSGPTMEDGVCDLCKEEFQKLQNKLKQGSTKTEIHDDLMEFCDKIPLTAVKDECRKIIAEDFDLIYDELIALVDPSTVCTAIRLCTQVSVEKYVKSMMDKLPTMLQKAMKEGKLPVAAPFDAKNLPAKVEVADSCADCETFVRDFQDTAMNNKKVVDDWLNMLKTECDAVGGELATLCQENVETMVFTVLDILNPKAVCKGIMMCDAFSIKAKSDDMCADCKTFFTEFQQELKNNPAVLDKIVHAAAEFYCLQKPPEMREQCSIYVSMVIKVMLERMENECTSLLKKNLPQLWQLLEMTDVGTICTKLEFCNPPKTSHDIPRLAKKMSKLVLQSMPKRKTKVTGEPCDDCKAFITDLQGVIQNNKSLVQELVDLVKQECDQLGPEFAGACRLYVDENYESVLKQFASYDADTICYTIMMCSEVKTMLKGDLCTDCVAFFGDWQSIIQNNQSIITGVMKKAKEAICGGVPELLKFECDKIFDEDSKEIANAVNKNCATLVKEYLPQLWDLISSTDPEDVCATLYFCDDCDKPELKQLEGEPCPDCKNFITDLQGVIQNNQTLVQELVDLVKQQCDQLGVILSGVCQVFVNDNYESVLKQFDAEDVGTICTTIDMCGQSAGNAGGDICTDCVAFFGDWQTIIQNNQSIVSDVSKKAKQAICGAVPDLLKDECDKLFDEDEGKIINAIKNTCATLTKQYLPLLWDTISSTDPEDVCATLYFCDAKAPKVIKAALIQAAQKSSVVGGELECQACQFAIEEIEKMVEGNKTEETVAKALENVCELYGEDIREECKAFIEQYGADIIDFIIQELNSFDICSKLGLCEKAQKFHIAKKEETKEKFGGEIECDVCMAVLTEVERVLSDNATEQEILDMIMSVCTYLGKEEEQCKTLVSEYGQTIILLILEEAKPDTICAAIKACTQSKVKNVNADVECELCKVVATELDNLVGQNSTEAEIEAALEKVCSLLPSDDKEECDSLVHEFGPEIIMLLKKELAPDVICTQLKLCTEYTVKAKNVNSDVECELCKVVATELDNLVGQNSTEAEIEAALEKVCSLLPSDDKEECDSLVHEFGPEIIMLLKKELAPDVICTQLKLCPAYNVKIPGLCALCEAIMRYVDDHIDVKSTEAEIKKALDDACSELPAAWSEDCKKFVDKYGMKIVDLILEVGTSPLLVCKALALCSEPPKVVAPVLEQKIGSEIECGFCVALFTEVDKILDDKTTEEAILNAISRACSILGKEADECKMIINEYGPAVIKMIVQELGPNEICALIKACTKSTVKDVNSDIYCELCNAIAGELEGMINKNTTEAEIEAALEAVCSIVPSEDKEECDNFVHEYGPTIAKLLIQELAPDVICKQLKLCTNSAVKMQKVKETAQCHVCKLVVQELDKLIDTNSTEAEIEKALDAVCDILPSDIAKECEALVSEFGPEIAQLLKEELKPDVICVQLKLCTNSPTIVASKSSELCDICKLVAEELDNILDDKSTEDEIVAAVEKVCGLLPSQYKDACDTLVKEYGSMIIEFLATEMNPSVICVEVLHVCPAAKKVTSKSSELCDICKLVAEELDNILDDKSTEDEIVAAVEKVCGLLPSQYKDTCDTLVKEYGPMIIEFLAMEMNPSVICVEVLHVCPAAKKVQTVTSDVECEVCTLIAEELDNLLSEKSTQAEIEAALEEVCGILPSDFKDTCDSLIKQYFTMIVDFLVEEFNPSKICVQIKLCPGSLLSKKTRTATSNLECEVCTLIATELDNLLSENSTQAEIEAALVEVCSILPSDFKDTCDSLIKQYSTVIVEFLVEEFNPSKICVQIKLCPGSQAAKKVVGEISDCKVCQWIAQGLDDLLKEKAVQAEIEAALREVCSILPSEVKGTCEALIMDNWETIIGVLVGEMKPNIICTDIKVCPDGPVIKKVDSDVSCEACELAMTELDLFLKKNSTQEEIVKLLEKVCSIVSGSTKDECMSLISQYGDTIIDILIEVGLTPREVCPKLGLCPANSTIFGEVKKIDSQVECDVCEVIVHELDIILSDQSTEKAILDAVKNICNILPEEDRVVCRQYISNYGPGVVDILVHEMVPSKVCAKLHACQAKTVKHPIKLRVENSETCTLCKEIVKELDEIMKNNYTIAALEAALDQVCDQLPATFADECKDLVAEFGPMLAQYIDHIGDPAFVCQHLKLCPTDLNPPKIFGTDKCTYGPSYWCKDMVTARSCNAVSHCMNHVW